MALTKVNNDLQDVLAAAQPSITSVGTLTGLTVGGNTTIQKDDALLFIKETDGTNIAAVGDHTGAGQGCVFLYNHGGTATTQLKADSASTIGHGLTVDGTTNTTLSIEGDTSAGSTFINFADGTATTKAQISGAKAGASGGRLTFSTNNSSGTLTEAMKIDQVGRVTQPHQPSFSAAMSSDTSVSGGLSIIFDTVTGQHWNTGGHYSTSNGRFTAPVAGKYFFSSLVLYASLTDGQTMTDAFWIRVNNVTHSYSFRRSEYVAGTTGEGGYYSDFSNKIVNLAAGDYVHIVQRATFTVHGNQQYSWFNGYLIG